MAYSLEKPYTEDDRIDFIIKYDREQGLKIVETDTCIYALLPNEIIKDGKPVVNPNYHKEIEEEEQERINNLTMTALDFITFLQQAGLTLEQINAYLESNLSVKMQLTYCQNVYCGVVKQLMPISVGNITITADMVEAAFKKKNEV